MLRRCLPEIARSLLTILIWLSGALIIGVYIAGLDGNHGSIVYVILAGWLGLAAGALHLIVRWIRAILRRRGERTSVDVLRQE